MVSQPSPDRVSQLRPDSPHFEERAENLEPDQFRAWTSVSAFEKQVLGQLTSRTPRLLVGPRGCGKTTLLLLAQDSIRAAERDVPIYVNYVRASLLENVFFSRPDADAFFQDWLVAKIMAEAAKAPEFESIPSIEAIGSRCREFVDRAERNQQTEPIDLPGPAQMSRMLLSWTQSAGRGGVILLLDDAAQLFAPRQQRIFFDFLQKIRTPTLAYKAATYPGVTEYSPSFNIGHDAKTVDAWVSSNTAYIPFMREILTKRTGGTIPPRMSADLVDLLAVASFGIPRTFLSMVERFLFYHPEPSTITNTAIRIVDEQVADIEQLFHQLAKKVPAYAGYVEAGILVEEAICRELRKLNQSRSSGNVEQAVEVAIKEPLDKRLDQILALLEYAGIVRRSNESVSYGDDRVYKRIAVHSGVLMARRVLHYGKNPTLRARADAALRKSRQLSSKRVSSSSILPPEVANMSVLRLGPCERCNQPRNSMDGRFCSSCGHELREQSRFSSLVRAGIEELPLTDLKRRAIADVGFNTVEDILNDRGQVGLRQAKSVGKVWGSRIYSYALEYVSL